MEIIEKLVSLSFTPEVLPLELEMGICKLLLYFHHSGENLSLSLQ